MSYRNLSLSYSGYPASPSNGQQSPLAKGVNQQAIKTRLNFSSAKLPTPKRPLINHHALSANSPLNSFYQSRIGGYHMSRQNPNILDEMYTPPPASHNGEVWNNRDARSGGEAEKNSWFSKSNISPRLGGVTQQSSLRRALQRRAQNSSPSSLVQLATRKNTGRLLRNGIGKSPVTVKLAGIKKEQGQPVEANMKADQQTDPDPCDKEVVLSALRQRRKRWASSTPEENDSFAPTSYGVTSPPTSKRSRNSIPVHVQKFVLPDEPPSLTTTTITVDRKRSHFTPAAAFPTVKKVKANNLCGPTNALSLSGMECEEEELEEEGGGVSKSVHNSLRTKENLSAPAVVNGICSGRGSRGLTPPILINEDEIDKKRDESLGTLTAVFTSPHETEKKNTLRRKLPIFCGTGTKPHLPSPLSATHSVIQEDLKKDREAIAVRLKAFLTAEDETDGVTSPSSSSSTATAGVGVVFSTPVSTSSDPTAPPTSFSLPASVSSITATVSVAKSLSTKTVSFAPLPTSLATLR